MSGTMQRRVARLECTAGPGFDLAEVIEVGRSWVRSITDAELRAERLGRVEEMRARAEPLNRLERDMLAGMERALAG